MRQSYYDAMEHTTNEELITKQEELYKAARKEVDQDYALINQLYAIVHKKGSISKAKEMLKQEFSQLDDIIYYQREEGDECVELSYTAETEEDRERMLQEAMRHYKGAAGTIVTIRELQVYDHLIKYVEELRKARRR